MSQSIMQTTKKCYFTGDTRYLEKHHCLMGSANRKKAEEYGLWVWLSHSMHMSIHQNHNYYKYRLYLEQQAQRKFEEIYGHEKFMEEFHKNYL